MNLAQSDPDYIPQASKDGRLFLSKGHGPLSAGTCVKLVRGGPADRWKELTVSAEIGRYDAIHKIVRRIEVEVDVPLTSVVIRRSGHGSSVAGPR